ncbi:MAG: restriction endonuclease subunit S [Methanosarcinales archaeon]|nr:restriction endonuclease subunit S [Methanosarcinales archaeon]
MNKFQSRGDIHTKLEGGNAGGNYHKKLEGSGGMKTPQAPLKEVASFIKRGITPKYVEDDGICVLNQKCIRDGRVSLEPARLTNKNIHINAEKVLQNGDILINSTGTGTLGRTAPFFYSNGIEQAVVDTHVTIVRPETGTVNARYLAYVLRQCEPTIVNMAKGATNQVELSARDMELLPIKLRDRQEQDRIASILSAYDDLIENNRRRIQLLEQAARLLYREWFVHLRFPGHEHVTITDGVPEGWEKTTVESISSFISRGITPKYDDEAPGIVLNQKCIRNQRLDVGLARRQSKEVPLNKLVLHGDVLINSTGQGTLGRVAQFLSSIENCTVDSHVTIARPDKEVPMLLYGQHIVSMENYLATMGRGATNQTELSKDTVAELPFLYPSHFLAEEFETFAKETAGQVQNLMQQNTMLTQARNLLLPRLMNGEVAV